MALYQIFDTFILNVVSGSLSSITPTFRNFARLPGQSAAMAFTYTLGEPRATDPFSAEFTLDDAAITGTVPTIVFVPTAPNQLVPDMTASSPSAERYVLPHEVQSGVATVTFPTDVTSSIPTPAGLDDGGITIDDLRAYQCTLTMTQPDSPT